MDHIQNRIVNEPKDFSQEEAEALAAPLLDTLQPVSYTHLEYTAPSNIFSPMNAGQFKQTLKEALGNRDFLSHLLDRQREHAHVATPEDYKKVIG